MSAASLGDQKKAEKDRPLAAPVNLMAAMKVFQDTELAAATRALLQFKKKLAFNKHLTRLGHSELQVLLQEANRYIVRCGCDVCWRGAMGEPSNYDYNPEYDAADWAKSEERAHGPFVQAERCLLYAWFRARCMGVAGTPVPPETPLRDLYPPQAYTVVTVVLQLGVAVVHETEKKRYGVTYDETWLGQVQSMAYPAQEKTVYSVLHGIHTLIDQAKKQPPRTFSSWFRWQGLSLMS